MKIFQENNQPNGWNLEGVDLFGHESYGVEAGSSASLSITSAKEIEERFKRRIIKKLKLMKYKCDGWTWEDRAQQLIHRARQDSWDAALKAVVEMVEKM